MPNALFPLPMLLMIAVPAGAVQIASRPDEVRLAQLTIRQRIVIRIPRMPDPSPRATPFVPPMRWKERRGPKCVPADALVAATIADDDSVDLMTRNGERLRARLDRNCEGLNFYSGFYVHTNRDGKLCADRDSIRLRSGDTCAIDSFRRLVPER